MTNDVVTYSKNMPKMRNKNGKYADRYGVLMIESYLVKSKASEWTDDRAIHPHSSLYILSLEFLEETESPKQL